MRDMYPGWRCYFLCTVFFVQIFVCNAAVALEFQPGVGLGLEHTDNARLTQDNTVDDLIAVTYVGANISENDGSLVYQATGTFNKQNYTKDTFEDQRYVYLNAIVDWAMIEDRFIWTVSDYFSQVPVSAVGSTTPNNLQNTNVFTFGADIWQPLSARQSFSILPSYRQIYFEKLSTDNKQYSLAASWQYQAFRLTGVSLNLGARKIDYTETDSLGQTIQDQEFTNASVTINGQRLRSVFSVNAGATNVKRDNGEEATGFTGFLKWSAEMSSRSAFNTLISTDLTDSGTVAVNAAGDSGPVNDSGVQITTDVIRNSIVNLSYSRDDASLSSGISARYQKVRYSDNVQLDRIIRDFSLNFGHPVTQLLSSGAYLKYIRINQYNVNSLDKGLVVGGTLNYKFSRKLNGSFDLNYRQKESTVAIRNYEEFSVFASLVYGFGQVNRPSRSGF